MYTSIYTACIGKIIILKRHPFFFLMWKRLYWEMREDEKTQKALTYAYKESFVSCNFHQIGNFVMLCDRKMHTPRAYATHNEAFLYCVFTFLHTVY